MAKKQKTSGSNRPALVVCPEIIEFVAKKMALGFRHYELKAEIERELETSIARRTYENLHKQAKKHLTDILLTPEEHRCNAIEMIYQVVQDPSTKSRDRLRASEILLNAVSMIPEEQAQSRAQHIRELLKDIGDPFEDS